MRIDQYAYFGLSSPKISAAEIGAMVGSDADESVVRGLRQQDPPVPVEHSWKIVCRKPRMTVDEQVGEVLARVRPLADRIRKLVDSTDVTAGLQIVRYVNDADGQNDLFGWHLDLDQLDLLVSIRADIDVDEYGMNAGRSGR